MWEGEDELRPDRSVCWDKSLSLYIKLVPFENNGGYFAAWWRELQAVKKHLHTHICMTSPLFDTHIQVRINYMHTRSFEYLLQRKQLPLGAADCLSSLPKRCLRHRQVFFWYTRYLSWATPLGSALQQKGRSTGSAGDTLVCSRSWDQLASWLDACWLQFVQSIVSTCSCIVLNWMFPLLCNYGAPQTKVHLTRCMVLINTVTEADTSTDS